MALVAGLSMIASTVNANACPQGTRIRYSWYDLPETEKQRFVSAVRKLHTDTDTYNKLAKLHYDQRNEFHNCPRFLPAHRRLLIELENALKAIDPQVVLPYWDWSRFANNPSADPIWAYFARDGEGKCVTDGVLGDKKLGPYEECLQRGIDRTGPQPGTYASLPVLLAEIKKEGNFWEWAKNLEASAHNAVHYYVGGHLASHWSAFDPLFYMHHLFIDQLWDVWQRTEEDGSRINRYGGEVDGVIHQINDPVSGKWDSDMPIWTDKVHDLMDTSKLCYTYRASNSPWIGPVISPPQSSSRPSSPSTTPGRSSTPVSASSPSTTPGRSNTPVSASSSTPAPQPASTSKSVASSSPAFSSGTPVSSSSVVTESVKPTSKPAETNSKAPTESSLRPNPSHTLSVTPPRPTESSIRNGTIPVCLGPPLLPIPEEYRRMMGIPDEFVKEAYKEIAEVYNEVHEDIKAGKPIELPGYASPVKLEVVKGAEYINTHADETGYKPKKKCNKKNKNTTSEYQPKGAEYDRTDDGNDVDQGATSANSASTLTQSLVTVAAALSFFVL